jgi:hypothetical protein
MPSDMLQEETDAMGRIFYFGTIAVLVHVAALMVVKANESEFATWPVLVNPFESTSGGGVMIDGYKPVVTDGVCRTDFTVKLPDQPAPLQNEVVFDAVPRDGGILCTNGRWRAKDGSAQGTTPFRLFIKDGVVRRPPA